VVGVSQPAGPSASKALLVYNALRFLLLAGCLGLGYLAGLRGLPLVIAALLVSGVLSWFLLRTQRIRAGLAVEQAVQRSAVAPRVAGPWQRRREAMRAKVAAEDAYADSVRGAQQPETLSTQQPQSPSTGQPQRQPSDRVG
jgi:hypothetical protein